MIGYVTLGANDIEKAREFYAGILAVAGASELQRNDEYNGFTFYGTGFDKPMLCITRPYNGEKATAGNGQMTGLLMESREKVDALYAKAMEVGGSDEGAPGLRDDEGDFEFYAAYFRDPEGNKLCAYHVTMKG